MRGDPELLVRAISEPLGRENPEVQPMLAKDKRGALNQYGR
jgi:hypothetical protein